MVTCSGFIEPLNLECILVNMFAGSVAIFMFIAIVVLAMGTGRLKMRNGVGLMMLALFSIFFANYFGGIYLLSVLVIGFIVYTILRRIVSRQ